MIQSEAKPIAPQSHNARYAKLCRQVGDVNFDIRNLVRRSVANFRLLRTRTYLFAHGMREKQVIGKGLIQFLSVAGNQPHVLALYV